MNHLDWDLLCGKMTVSKWNAMMRRSGHSGGGKQQEEKKEANNAGIGKEDIEKVKELKSRLEDVYHEFASLSFEAKMELTESGIHNNFKKSLSTLSEFLEEHDKEKEEDKERE